MLPKWKDLFYQYFFWILIIATSQNGNSVRIKELRVPEVTRHGTAVVLDCDYALDDTTDHEGLVVKWYLNDELRPVYQWIPGEKNPQGLGILRDKLNLAYKASGDARTMHRALHILKPSAELSGEYTCVVSTFRNEDRKTKKMIVFVPEKNLHVKQSETSLGSPSVVCSADGVYPKPELTIRMVHDNMSWELNTTYVSSRRNQDTGLYDISAIATLPTNHVPDGTPMEVACELHMPEVNYSVRREAIFYSGNAAISIRHHNWITVYYTFCFFLLNKYS